MKVHLIDGTYELFRHFFAIPSRKNGRGEEIAAARGVVGSMLSLLEGGATHIAVATDQIIESFRNEMWADYKTGAGIDPALFSQFPILEEALQAMGVMVWAMVEYEADDALAAGAALCTSDQRVEQVLICTPDKDLAQCVRGKFIVQFDRRRRLMIDEGEVKKKFGVLPESIPDYLALVGDSADGYPGLPGWGATSASTVLAKYVHLENIPEKAKDWKVTVRAADRLASVLKEQRDLVFLFRKLATLVSDGPVNNTVDELLWTGPTSAFPKICARLEADEYIDRAARRASMRTQFDQE